MIGRGRENRGGGLARGRGRPDFLPARGPTRPDSRPPDPPVCRQAARSAGTLDPPEPSVRRSDKAHYGNYHAFVSDSGIQGIRVA